MSEAFGLARSFEHDGTVLHFFERGPADARTVILTHGAATHHGIFEALVEALAAHDYRVIAWDLAGHGASQPFRGKLSVRRMAEELEALVRTVGADTVDLVGQSMGADVVQEFALRFRERARSAVLVGGLPLIRQRSWMEAASAWWSAQKLRIVPLERFRRGVSHVVSLDEATRDNVYEAMCLIPRKTLVGIWSAIARAPRKPSSDVLPCPVLLVVGAEDHLGGGLLRTSAESWSERDTNVDLAIIENAAHMTHADNPGAFNAAVLAFLDRDQNSE